MSKIYTRNCEILDNTLFPSNMHRIALGVEYNGSLFRGFQSQSSGVKTVQQSLEAVLSTICDEPITLVCAGRTDRGVHATRQVVHFDTQADRPLKAWLRGVNTQLTDGVSVRWAKEIIPTFHARFSARSRTYRYVIHNCLTPAALLNNLVTWDRRRFDLDAMRKASQYLIGEHDFNAFRGADCQAKTSIRHLHRIEISQQKDFIIIEVQANAFLYHMVRNLVGVLTAVAAGEKPPEWVPDVLASCDRRCAGVTAPAAGLYLVAIDYPDIFQLDNAPQGPYFIQ